MRPYFPLFKTTCLNLKRGRAFEVLFIFAFILLAASNLFTFFTREEELKMIKDLGLMAINIFGVLLVLFGLSHHLPREIEDKTLYTLLTNPTSRNRILGAGLGAYLYLLFISFFLMAVLFLGLLYIKEGSLDFLMVKGIIIIFLKLITFSSLVLFFSVILPPIVNIAFSLFIYVGGHLTNYLTSLADQKEFWGWFFFKSLYTVLPNFENFNCSDSLVLGRNVSWGYIGLIGLYSLLYSSVIFILAAWLFKYKEI